MWPEDRRAAITISFDNLGEAAEIELGLRSSEDGLGGHYSVQTALPIVLAELAAAQLPATFFVEGLNAAVYPQALHSIVEAGHEVAYHGFRHEEWSRLAPAEEADNLARGVAAFAEIGIAPVGFRPPGGLLSPVSVQLLADHGMTYCSPAGVGAGPTADGFVMLPFGWRAVDAYHVLPGFSALRAHLDGSETAQGIDGVRTGLRAAIADALRTGDHRCLVLHNWMIEAERDLLAEIFADLRARAGGGELWVACGDEVARWIHDRGGGTEPRLDTTSWTAPS